MEGIRSAEAVWTTADYAFVVSIFSAVLSLLSFSWNVWSKFIFPKPKLKVSGRFFVSIPELDLVTSLSPLEGLPREFIGKELSYPAIGLEVHNFGPQAVSLFDVFGEKQILKKRRSDRSRFSLYRSYPPAPDASESEKWIRYGILDGQKVEVGESFRVFFPVSVGMFERLSMGKIGIEDGFRRTHYVPKEDMKQIKQLAGQLLIGYSA